MGSLGVQTPGECPEQGCQRLTSGEPLAGVGRIWKTAPQSGTAVGSNPGSATLQMWDVLNLYDLSFLNLVKVVLIQP